MADCYDFVIKLRAVRDFQETPLAEEDLNRILEAGRWTGSSKNRQDWVFVVITGDRLQELAGCGSFTKPVRDSAATVVLVQEEGGNLFDIGRAAQNMMLAAKAIGVASCPITLHQSDKARQLVGAPQGTVVRYAVALGYPGEGSAPARFGGRKDIEIVARRDHY